MQYQPLPPSQSLQFAGGYRSPPSAPSPTSSTTTTTTSTPSAAASLPFFLVPNMTPQQPLLPDIAKRPRPSFPVTIARPAQPAQPSQSSNLSMSPEDRLQLHLNQSTFKGPQHKHAHHLHTIPPREKTTRTLILDHMLWLHARARFAQARAELGLNPERAGGGDDDDEDDMEEDFSDGECSTVAVGKEKDAINARAYKARADGLEKVLSAMLDQPPEDLPFDADDLLFRDTSFALPTTPALPNGVRLRLALAGLINDVFTEDEFTIAQSPDLEYTSTYYLAPPPPISAYTPALQMLSRLSSFAHNSDLPVLPPFQSFAATADPNANIPPAQSILPPAGSIFSSIPRGAGPESPWALGSSLSVRQSSSSTSSGGFGGSFGSSSMMPPPPPRRISVAGDMGPPPPPRVFRAVGRSRDLYNSGTATNPNRASGSSSRPHRCPHHITYACPPSSFCLSSLNSQSPIKTSKSRTRSSIGAGLASPGPPLRRSSYFGKNDGKDARLTDLIPRFLRLSALVAVELGREARGEDERAEEAARVAVESGKKKEGLNRARAGSGAAEAVPSSGASNVSTDSDDEPSSRRRLHARPTKLWYKLLAGLLTRATLQGYLVKGWKGTDPIEILLGLGVGSPPTADKANGMDDENDDEEDEEDKDFEPDDMPDLTEAWHVLFGFKSAPPSAREAFDEYERLMGERISDFFTIPTHCTDLSIHLDDLTHKYPSQPVDRSVLGFCEAVAKWRGRPELETYKSRPSEPPTPGNASSSNLSIHSLIHPQPPAKPLIERYFVVPSKSERAEPSGWEKGTGLRRDSVSSSGTKRSRRTSWTDGKGKKVVLGQAWLEDEEYVGPYGI